MATSATATVKIDKILYTLKKATIRSGSSSSSKAIGYVLAGQKVPATQTRNGYYYITQPVAGWITMSSAEVFSNRAPSGAVTVLPNGDRVFYDNGTLYHDIGVSQQKEIQKTYVNTEYKGSTNIGTSSLLTTNLNGIYGLPYQFPASVDAKLPGTQFGAIYAERMIARMPLLMLSPGKVSFMSDYSNGEKRAVFDALANKGSASQLNDFISKPGKYYTFEYDTAKYWTYVNTMNHACASYLGIGDVTVNINGVSGALSSFKWERACNSKFDSLLISNKDYVCFYTDAETTKQESFENSTTRSQLADSVNSMSDVAKEIKFLVGSHTGGDLKFLDNSKIESAIENVRQLSEDLLGGSLLLNNLAKEFSVIATGGKLIFPEIWSDSEFTQSFDAKLKLRCPCPNKVSWFLDICSPLNHLIAMTLPASPSGKSLAGTEFTGEDASMNGYMTPFIVRAFYRGLFNCDMGMMSLSISKGKEGSWTLDGLPSEVDVDISIKDLYNVMAMTPETQTAEFLNNTMFLNYMANACGVSINKPDIERSIDLWAMGHGNTWKNRLTGYNFWQSTTQGIRNAAYNMYTGIFKG